MFNFLGKTLLIVDDDIMVREVLGDFFEDQNMKIVQAGSGNAAFKILQSQQIDLVITDVRMEDGDGITLAKDIRDKLSYKPVLFICSGYHDLEPALADELGVACVFQKPLRSKQLIAKVAEVIGISPS